MTIYPPASLHGVFSVEVTLPEPGVAHPPSPGFGVAGRGRLQGYRFTLMAWARERMDQVEVRTITAKRTNSAATFGRSRCAKRSLRKRKARRRMEVFE